jgi:DNA-binding transcriptional LysR family regulator
MAIEGLGVAVIPAAIVETELANGRLQELKTNLLIPPLTFSASWLASPEMVAIERVAELAAKTAETSAHSDASVDAAPPARHATEVGYQEVKA